MDLVICEACRAEVPCRNMFLHQLYCSGETFTPDTVESGNPPEADPIERLSVQALKRELDSADVPHGDCLEKSELVALLQSTL